jgi:hypothetical protein
MPFTASNHICASLGRGLLFDVISGRSLGLRERFFGVPRRSSALCQRGSSFLAGSCNCYDAPGLAISELERWRYSVAARRTAYLAPSFLGLIVLPLLVIFCVNGFWGFFGRVSRWGEGFGAELWCQSVFLRTQS